MMHTSKSLKAALKASEILDEYGAIYEVEHLGLTFVTFKVYKQPLHLGDVVFEIKPDMTKREIRKVIESDKNVLRDITAPYDY